jgi:uncharacterized protein YbjT (DUF2867 family)
MHVLVTGGTDVVAEGVLRALLERGHEARLSSPSADAASRPALSGAATGCEAVVHLDSQGTANVVEEAGRAGVPRLVYLSSLGAGRAFSDEEKKDFRAEALVRGFAREWVVLRASHVYGPGDEILSPLLKMVRTLPAIPVIEGGSQRFQPIWYEDLGRAVVAAIEKAKVARQTLHIAGPEEATLEDVIDRLGALTGRAAMHVPVPAILAPLVPASVWLLEDEHVMRPEVQNALYPVLGVEPTPLREGLEKLVSRIPENLPSAGVGPLRQKRFWADIGGSSYRARDLRGVFRSHLRTIMPVELSLKGGATPPLRKGTTFSFAVPLRGVMAMRVEEVTPTRITAVTLDGHPLAGVVSFHFIERGTLVRFEVEITARAATWLDRVVMGTVGGLLQDASWRGVVERFVEATGGTAAEGVQSAAADLDDARAREMETWMETLVARRKRETVRTPAASRTAAPARKAVSSRGAANEDASAGRSSGPRNRAGSGSSRTRDTNAPLSVARRED